MPKRKPLIETKLKELAKLFGNDVFSFDEEKLYCHVCECNVSSVKKYYVQQHVKPAQHKGGGTNLFRLQDHTVISQARIQFRKLEENAGNLLQQRDRLNFI